MRKFKKGCVAILALTLSMALMTGCGDKANTGKIDSQVSTEATASDSADKADKSQTLEEMVDKYAKDVKLGEYKGIKYEQKDTSVSDEEVKEQVDEFLEQHKEFDKDTKSAAKNGDVVNIDFVGTVDGEEFDGGNTQGSGYDLTLGSKSFIDDFEDQIAGHKPGETFVVKVTFPEAYGNEKLNGKDAEFKTTLNYIKVDKPTVYNDELVAKNTEYKTTKEYEDSIRKTLTESKESNARSSAQNEIMVNIIQNATISNMSAETVQANADQMEKSIKAQAENSGVDYATYIYYYYGFDDEEKFKQQIYQVCEESEKEKMVMCAIAKAEGITVTDKETEEFLEDYAKKNSVDVESIKKSLSDTEIKYSALAEKVMNDVLLKNAKGEAATTEASTEATTEATTEKAE